MGRGTEALPIVTFIVLAAVMIVLGYQRWTAEPLAPVTGWARAADGDSIEIAGARIRLEGIDAPELHQTCADRAGQPWSCGRTAADELRKHLAGHEVTCRPSGVDRYQRLLAICFLADGSDINAWLVRQGWALAYGRGNTYQSEQRDAQAARRGIWAGSFTPPAEWRKQHPQ
jgi:endonuclease YncB( thermonuclease family)